eukprot:TRINITY_DN42863_c0_g1_i1.p1 TRINITY_DN42863_c0_g1~~TRINITY_DN42863_c0_g1_i1.p1  ORF type:complete len:620 (+),score=72.81 TRINITY_DN42863_c0_g1_i1:75-1934(+)
MPGLWTQKKCKCLNYTGLQPNTHYNIPLFLHNNDFNEVFITDEKGMVSPCCQDYVYEALDHSLFWLKCLSTESGCVALDVYTGMPGGCGGPRLSPAEEVLAFTEFFRGGRTGLFARGWEVSTEGEEVAARRRICTEPFLKEGGIGAPECGPAGAALWVEPGEADLMIRRTLSPAIAAGRLSRLHLRAHFYDDGEVGDQHWLGFRSSVGTGAVGLTLSSGASGACYVYLHTVWPGEASARSNSWQHSHVPRIKGWHSFEMVWEGGELQILIDTEPISKEVAGGLCAETEVCLASGGLGYGVWAGIEVFHTPIGQSTWAVGVQDVTPGTFSPWQFHEGIPETGFWQDSGLFVIPRVSLGKLCKIVDTWPKMVAAFEAHGDCGTPHPNSQHMLNRMYEIVEELDGKVALLCPDGELRYFPPAVCLFPEEKEVQARSDAAAAIVAEVPPLSASPAVGETQQSAVEKAAVPATPAVPAVAGEAARAEATGLTITCWALSEESDLDQMERAVAHFIAMAEAQGVALPPNIRLIAPCKEAAHKRCFVYRFGTRRLHFAVRQETDDRLQVVVRCGGGFMDFMAFARRNGGLEHLRMRRVTGAVHMSSVLVAGGIRVREVPRPSPRAT